MESSKIIGKILRFILFLIIFTFILAWPVMVLWNYALVSAIDGINPINFMQALAINILSSILFINKSSTKKNND